MNPYQPARFKQFRNGMLLGLAALLISACGGAPTPTALPTDLSAPSETPAEMAAQASVEPAVETPVEVPVEPVGQDVPATLIAPTQLPTVPTIQPTQPPTVSAVQRIRDEGVLRIGVLFNAPPMSRLDERGRVVGYEADLARGIAADWGVEPEFIQVTRQTAVPMLLAGEVDILLASIVHWRGEEAQLGFSQTYFQSGEIFLGRDDSDVTAIDQLNGRRVGVVQGTESERALGRATNSGRLSVTPVFYLTLDQAVGALGSGEIDALLGNRVDLLGITARTEGLRLIETMLEPAPYAIAYRPHDEALGYLLDRSLQKLFVVDGFAEIRRTWFPNGQFELEVPVWAGLDDDTRVLADFDTTLVYPAASVVTHIQAGDEVRLAGLNRGEGLSGLNQRLEAFYEGIALEMGRRWNVGIAFIPDSAANGVDLVANGQADLAIGVTPAWTGPYEVAYSAPLIQHGKRLMLPTNSDVNGFADLRGGKWIGIFAGEPGAADQVNELAASVNTSVNIFTIINDEDAVYSMLVDGNADVVFGDSLRLLPLLESNADLVKLTDRWYSTEYTALAASRLDPDFRALVDITLQAMAADGTLTRLWDETLGFDQVIDIEQWPGPVNQFMGVRIGLPPQ